MIKYSKKHVLIIILTFSILIFSVVNIFFLKIFSDNVRAESKQEMIDLVTEEPKVKIDEQIDTIIEEQKKKILNIWKIIIPRINVDANIEEGTTANVIANNVGHFISTNVINGNIGLAAHNRGYDVESYFKNIKELQIGDEIIYQKDDFQRTYEVVINTIIDETDWSYLQNTEDNRITLITCVEDQPEYRRCVQAIEYKNKKGI